MSKTKICPKCGNEMLESSVEGSFSAIRNDQLGDGTKTTRYMCKECGYIEEYAMNPKFYQRKI